MASKYAIQIAYDGSEFCGWQAQRGVGQYENRKQGIEAILVDAIAQLCGEETTVVASGRTDAGVHASGQVAHFLLQTPRDSEKNFLNGLNNLLPESIRIHRLGHVPDSFNAKFTVRKQYSYYFQSGPANLPHLRAYSMWNRYDLDEDLMQEALQHLVGEHDFLPFCGGGAKVSSTVRKIHEAEITREAIPRPGCFDSSRHHLLRMRICGSGFLKYMVRSIAGTLKQIGEGRRPPDDMAEILESKDRGQVGQTAPASGLWLDRVWYRKQSGIDFLDQIDAGR